MPKEEHKYSAPRTLKTASFSGGTKGLAFEMRQPGSFPWNFLGKNTGVGFAISYSRVSPQPRNQTGISCIDRWILSH